MKIKDLKKWCEGKDDEDVVFACEYSHNSELYDRPTRVTLWVRPPQKKDFKHKDCSYFEEVEVNGVTHKYCNRKKDFIRYGDSSACSKFDSNSEKQINYCRECEECNKTYRHCKYVKDYHQIYVGDGYVSKL